MPGEGSSQRQGAPSCSLFNGVFPSQAQGSGNTTPHSLTILPPCLLPGPGSMKSVLRLGDVPVRPSEEEDLSMKPFRIQSDTAFSRTSRALHETPGPPPQQVQQQHSQAHQPQQEQQHLQLPPRSQTLHQHQHRPQPPSACPYCQAAETQRDEYLELENAMPRQRPRGWPSVYRIATSTAGPSGRSSEQRQSLGPMQLKWKAALSNIFKGRRGLDREAIRREEAVSWLVSSGVFREADAENLRQHFFKLPSWYALLPLRRGPNLSVFS